MNASSPQIYELKTESEWREALHVLRELRPELDIERVVKGRTELQARDYHLYGLAHEGRIVCVAGAVVHPHITRINDFWVHDLVTTEHARSHGFGEAMMRFLEARARELGCLRLSVHTRLNRERAQKFYEHRLDYDRYALVFLQDLSDR